MEEWGGGGKVNDRHSVYIDTDHHTWSVKLWNDSDSSVLGICNDIGHILLVIDMLCRECTVC